MQLRSILRRPFGALAILAALGTGASAQVPLSGNLSDITTGPLQGGVVYHVTGLVSVPAGATLTVQPGAIIKFSPGRGFSIAGNLQSVGTVAQPVIYTSIFDDSAGGDTNGDGSATTPFKGAWQRLTFSSTSDASLMQHSTVRYAGEQNFSSIQLFNSDMRVFDCTVIDGEHQGIHLGASVNGLASAAQQALVERCTILKCGGTAIDGVGIDMLANLLDNGGGSNGGNWVHVVGDPTIDGDLTIGPRNGFDGVIRGNVNNTLPAGRTLTLQAGTIYKSSRFITGLGSLVCQGTAQNPVIFTSEKDDSAGGDSNGDAFSTSPAPGDWAGLFLRAQSRLEFTEIRYGGATSQAAAVQLTGETPVLHDCVIEYSVGDGIRQSADLDTGFAVQRCMIRDCVDEAIVQVRAEDVPGFLDNVAMNNGKNWFRVNPAIASPPPVTTKWGPRNGLNDTLYLQSAMTVPLGNVHIHGAGLVVKLPPGVLMNYQGELHMLGTALDPVVYTDIRDDTAGGDTNNDGSTTLPAPHGWAGLRISPSSPASTLEHGEIRYGGSFHPLFEPGMVEIQSPNVTIRDMSFEFSAGSGLFLQDFAVCERVCATRNDQSGILLSNLVGDLDRLTCADNGGVGIQSISTNAYVGTISNAILWNNALGDHGVLDAGELRYSNGSAGFAGSDGNILVKPLFVSASLGDYRLQAWSPCQDAGDPLGTLDPDGTRADMGCFFRDACTPSVFCTGQTGACASDISWLGTASVSSGQPFTIRGENVPEKVPGIFFYSKGAPRPAQTVAFGTLCVGPTTRRLPVQLSSTQGPCTSHFDVDFNAWIASGADPELVLGQSVNGQWWYREPAAPGGAALSPAIRFAICPTTP